jgi:hypothetical protein
VSQLEDLPPDLRAVLSLLLRQRKGYADISGLLGISESAVHDRAHAALALLAPRQARALSAAEREELGEYLLGRQSPAQQFQTRTQLERSAAGREWARALAQELAPLAADPLPVIPPNLYEPASAIAQVQGGKPDIPRPPSEPSPPTPAPARPPSSRRGGAIVLGVLAVAVLVAVVLIVGIGSGGGSSHVGTSSTGTSTGATHTTPTTTTTSGASTTAAKPNIGKPLQLTAPEPATSKAVGVAYVLSQSGKRAFYLIAQGLAPTTGGVFYAVWLESSTAAPVALGSLPPLSSSGHTEGGGALPANAASFNRIVVTHETSRHPVTPGQVVLAGTFTLG